MFINFFASYCFCKYPFLLSPVSFFSKSVVYKFFSENILLSSVFEGLKMPIQLFLLKYNLALWRCQFTVWGSSPCCPSIFRGNLSHVLGWFQDFLCFDVLQFMYSWSSCKFPFLKFFFNTCSDFSICIFINFQKSSTMISLNVASPFFLKLF